MRPIWILQQEKASVEEEKQRKKLDRVLKGQLCPEIEDIIRTLCVKSRRNYDKQRRAYLNGK